MAIEAEPIDQVPVQENRAQMLQRGIWMYLASIPSKLLIAFVFMQLWAWFIVSLGIRGLSFWHSVGIILLLAYVRGWWEVHPASGPPTKLYWDDTLGTIFYEVVGAVATLGIGWLVHLLA